MERAKYAVGEIAIWANPITNHEQEYKGQQVTIVQIMNQKTPIGYEVEIDSKLRRIVLEEELEPATDGIPVTVDGQSVKQPKRAISPVNDHGAPLHLIDGEYYELAHWGESLSDGSRWAGLRKVEL